MFEGALEIVASADSQEGSFAPLLATSHAKLPCARNLKKIARPPELILPRASQAPQGFQEAPGSHSVEFWGLRVLGSSGLRVFGSQGLRFLGS